MWLLLKLKFNLKISIFYLFISKTYNICINLQPIRLIRLRKLIQLGFAWYFQRRKRKIKNKPKFPWKSYIREWLEIWLSKVNLETPLCTLESLKVRWTSWMLGKRLEGVWLITQNKLPLINYLEKSFVFWIGIDWHILIGSFNRCLTSGLITRL